MAEVSAAPLQQADCSPMISRLFERYQAWAATPRSLFARATLPVAGGLVGLAVIFGLTWLFAAQFGNGVEPSERIVARTLTVGNVESIAEEIAEDGPLLFADLSSAAGPRSVVLDHDGDDVRRGWRVYLAVPADDPDCVVEQVRGTDTFTGCDGATLTVDDLAIPEGICPIVENDETVLLGLTPDRCRA